MRPVASILLLTLLSFSAISCGRDSGKGITTTSGDSLSSATPSNVPTMMAGPSPRIVPIVVPPPIDPNTTFHPLIRAWNTGGDTLIADAGDFLHVGPSKAGILWRFEPGERWTVSREDGTVRMSGTVAGEALMYENVYGFVRLDDGALIAYSYDIGGNWVVYRVDEICASLEESLQIPSVYIQGRVIQQEPLLAATCDNRDDPYRDVCRDKMDGVVRGIAICVEQLGLDEHLAILP